jgi:hypothetical protein
MRQVSPNPRFLRQRLFLTFARTSSTGVKNSAARRGNEFRNSNAAQTLILPRLMQHQEPWNPSDTDSPDPRPIDREEAIAELCDRDQPFSNGVIRSVNRIIGNRACWHG